MNGISRNTPHSSKREFDIVLLKELENYNPSPVNAMVFSRDGKYLLSGGEHLNLSSRTQALFELTLSPGDDETVRVWNLETFECEQVLKNDEEWGQVTALTLMYPEGEQGIFGSGAPHLCVGSGRGAISIFPMESVEKVRPNFVGGYEEFSIICSGPSRWQNV